MHLIRLVTLDAPGYCEDHRPRDLLRTDSLEFPFVLLHGVCLIVHRRTEVLKRARPVEHIVAHLVDCDQAHGEPKLS